MVKRPSEKLGWQRYKVYRTYHSAARPREVSKKWEFAIDVIVTAIVVVGIALSVWGIIVTFGN